MAAFNFDDYGDRAEGGSLAMALNWAGAVLSILLIAGLASWGWKLWVRDVTGVPVVRALEGPMRVAPEDPGGLASQYQGLTVNRIAEERGAESLADRVVLAPRAATLDETEDLAMAELPAVEVAAATVAPAPVPAEADTAATEAADPAAMVALDGQAAAPAGTTAPVEEAVAALEAAPDIAPAAEPAAVTALGEAASATDLAVAAALGIVPEPEATTDPVPVVAVADSVPVVTPRPLVRPDNLTRVARVSAPAVDAMTGEIDPATIPAGTRLVQLGAYGDAAVARAEWANAEARFGDYMLGKERVVQEAQTGGRTFFRLRAMGFADLSDARRFCAVLVAEGANCIPVVQE